MCVSISKSIPTIQKTNYATTHYVYGRSLRPKDKRKELVRLVPYRFYPSELLVLCEQPRILNISVNAEEKQKLRAKGFENWSRNEYCAFRNAVWKFGSNNISKVAEMLSDKTFDEVSEYHRIFFERGPTEGNSIKEFIRKLKLKESRDLVHREHIAALKWKISQYTTPEQDLTFIGRKETTDYPLHYDRYLICELLKQVTKEGSIDDDVYARIRAEILYVPV